MQGRDAMLSVQRDFKTVFAHALAGKTDLDLSKLTQSFLVDHFFRDHLETYRIVRYICQDIVAQAVMMLKQHFSEKAPFSTALLHTSFANPLTFNKIAQRTCAVNGGYIFIS